MTQDEIINMARQAGFFVKDNEAYSPSIQEDHELTPYLVAFANLVAAKEREACAKVAYDYTVKVSLPNFYESAEYVAQAIREKNT